MKIGVLTYHREYSNLGTNMQAYCTLRAVQRAYPESTVELVDYAGWRPVMRPYLSGVSAQSLRNDWRRISRYREFFRSELVFSERRLVSAELAKSLEFIRAQHYDAIYVGSDTVLELRGAAKDELNAFWLDRSIAARKVMIAASAHSVTYESLSERRRRRMQAAVDEFALLGVRDEGTRRLLSHFTAPGDERLRLVPDPTFTYDIDYGPASRYLERRTFTARGPVVCLHLLRTTSWAADLASRFRRAGYLVASLRPVPYADVILSDLSPFEQMGIYRSFALMVTHRFHDAVFCFKNQTPVIAFPEHQTDITAHGESKMHTLFTSFGMDPVGANARATLTADYLEGVHRDVIAAFQDGRDRIGLTLRQHATEYTTFLKESSARVA